MSSQSHLLSTRQKPSSIPRPSLTPLQLRHQSSAQTARRALAQTTNSPFVSRIPPPRTTSLKPVRPSCKVIQKQGGTPAIPRKTVRASAASSASTQSSSMPVSTPSQPSTTGLPLPVPMPSPLPQPRVSFLTPREVWSPLATPIPGYSRPNGSSLLGPRSKAQLKSGIPKYQLRDPGVVPSSPSNISRPKASAVSRLASTSRTPQPSNTFTPSILNRSTLSDFKLPKRAPSPSRVELAHKPGLGTMIRSRAAASPPSQGEKLASMRPLSDSGVPPPKSVISDAAHTRHGRHLSEPPSGPLQAVLHTRPASYQPYSAMTATDGADGLRAPLLPARTPSTSSIASSSCSSASSLARHRAIRARPIGKVNGPRSNRSSVASSCDLSPPMQLREPDHARSMSSGTTTTIGSMLESDESLETGSTVSDLSIRTAATVNRIDAQDEVPFATDDDEDFDYEPYDSSITLGKTPIPFPEATPTPTGLPPPQDQCAPYLVPSSGPPVTLEWESDGPSSETDEAELVWRELEVKLGRKVRGRSLRRGRWIVKPVQSLEESSLAMDGGEEEDQGAEPYFPQLAEMERTPSDFSISRYLSPPTSAAHFPPSPLPLNFETVSAKSHGIVDDVVGTEAATALFDMSAPLVPSVSTSACTPFNTPALKHDTLRRSRRVKRKGTSTSVSSSISMSEAGHFSQSRTGSVDEIIAFGSPADEEVKERESSSNHPSDDQFASQHSALDVRDNLEDAAGSTPVAVGISRPRPVYRLDSHVISALSALKGVFDSPELNFALSSDSHLEEDESEQTPAYLDTIYDSFDEMCSPDRCDENDSQRRSSVQGGDGLPEFGGLGLGVPLELDSVYHLPTLSPSLRPSTMSRTAQRARSGIWPAVGPAPEPKSPSALESEVRVEEEQSHYGEAKGKDDSLTVTAPILVSQAEVEADSQVEAETMWIRDLDTGEMREVRVDELCGLMYIVPCMRPTMYVR